MATLLNSCFGAQLIVRVSFESRTPCRSSSSRDFAQLSRISLCITTCLGWCDEYQEFEIASKLKHRSAEKNAVGLSDRSRTTTFKNTLSAQRQQNQIMEAVENFPKTFILSKEFITPSEEQNLLKNVYAAPKPKWTELKNRRVQNWGGIPHKDKALLCSENMPTWLERIIDKVQAQTGLFEGCRPNHVLVNEYLPGQGILPHTDGPLYTPVVANITLGSHAVLEISRREDRQPHGKILLKPRSLLITKDEAYTDYLHGIDEVLEDVIDSTVVGADIVDEQPVCLTRQTRVSLTIRHVARVIRIGPLRKF